MIFDNDEYLEYLEIYEYITKEEYIELRKYLMNTYDIIYPLNIDIEI